MTISTRALLRASLAVLASTTAMPAWASADPTPDAGPGKDDILIVAQRQKQTIENTPNTSASIDADQIARTVNAMNVEDTIKYLPSLIVRKRHIGDTQAPLATRTSGLGASARSLIYADGALLSSLIGNNNTSASPRWSAVAPQEIARIDVLYGPFSAAYPGNSIGAVVNITTRLPDQFEATATTGVSVQTYDLYGRRNVYPAYQAGLTIGDRFGPLAVFASYDHVTSRGQPLGYVTAIVPTSTIPTGPAVSGALPDLNRTGQPIRVLGASGLENQGQDRLKLKAALDLTNTIRLTYVGGLFLNRTNAGIDSFLTSNGSGSTVYAGQVTIEGRPYNIAASAFSNGIYTTRQRHWWHALSLGGSSGHVDWQAIGTRYRFASDEQRSPTIALPAALAGGAGNITRLDGTGWDTADAKAAWRADDAATNVLSVGAHWDRFMIVSNRFATTDWISGAAGALNQQSLGRTQTVAVWAQDAWKIVPALTLTIGGRYEWWRAFDGVNFPVGLAASVKTQAQRSAGRFSPKASLGWTPAQGWNVQLSFGQAWRFPTVGELYQSVTTGLTQSSPDPTLRPERARSSELAIERTGSKGTIRLALFNEVVTDALIAQTGQIGTASVSFVQNVGRTRARGVEVWFVRNDILPRFDLSASVTYADATTRANAALPASVGKLIPTVPRWKATAVATWRPVDGVALTAAGRYSSRLYGTLDNSDVVGNTYQGFYKYFVVDLRAQFAIARSYTLGIGVDNVTNDRYFLFHPFPQRTLHADLTVRF